MRRVYMESGNSVKDNATALLYK